MLRMLRRAAPIGLLMAMFLNGTASAATINVSIVNLDFTPDPVSANLGDQITWTNTATATPHTTTSDTMNPDGSVAVGLWNSGTLNQGQTFSRKMVGGTFPYHCSIHPFMTGMIQVSPKIAPANGHIGTTFTLTFAPIDTGPKGFVFDVQKMDPGGQFQDYMTDVGTKSVTFVPSATGTYQFQVRIQRVSNGGVSFYSPPVSINVT